MKHPAGGSPNILRREGEFWTIVYEGRTCHLRDTLGMRVLAALVGRPGERQRSSELLGVVETASPAADPRTDERARVRATRALNRVLQKLAVEFPSLAAHLAATVHTGRQCVYQPDPRLPIMWKTDAGATAPRTSRGRREQ